MKIPEVFEEGESAEFATEWTSQAESEIKREINSCRKENIREKGNTRRL